MRIDKEKLSKIAELPDRELWQFIVSTGREHGFSLPDKTPSHEELNKLRAVVSGDGGIKLSDAVKILSKYRG